MLTSIQDLFYPPRFFAHFRLDRVLITSKINPRMHANALKSRVLNILMETGILVTGACSKMAIFFQLHPLAKSSPLECPLYMCTGV